LNTAKYHSKQTEAIHSAANKPKVGNVLNLFEFVPHNTRSCLPTICKRQMGVVTFVCFIALVNTCSWKSPYQSKKLHDQSLADVTKVDDLAG